MPVRSSPSLSSNETQFGFAATSIPEYSPVAAERLERQPRSRRSRRSRSTPPGGRKRGRRLSYPLKVAIVALLVAGTGISLIELNRRKSVAQTTTFPTTALTIAALPVGLPFDVSESVPAVEPGDVTYNVVTPPELENSLALQEIVDDIVAMVGNQGLPRALLSITLIDVKTKTIAGYQPRKLRYPASVAKMFWMVAYYARLAAGNYAQPLEKADAELYRMMYASDNSAASRILDWVTQSTSGENFDNTTAYEAWAKKREWINRFFRSAGYDRLTMCHKNFPFDNNLEPTGRDLKLLQQRQRNKTTTYQAARLLYEIFGGQSISQESSRRMARLLAKDLRPEAWKNDPDNPIKSFFGESLSPDEVEFASKVGWTSKSRQEAAYIKSRDGKAEYILVIFGDHADYANSWELFPQISKRIHQRMVGLTQIAAEETGVPGETGQTEPLPSP